MFSAKWKMADVVLALSQNCIPSSIVAVWVVAKCRIFASSRNGKAQIRNSIFCINKIKLEIENSCIEGERFECNSSAATKINVSAFRSRKSGNSLCEWEKQGEREILHTHRQVHRFSCCLWATRPCHRFLLASLFSRHNLIQFETETSLYATISLHLCGNLFQWDMLKVHKIDWNSWWDVMCCGAVYLQVATDRQTLHCNIMF